MAIQSSNGTNGPDRRRHLRLPMTIPVSIMARDGACHTVQSQDISWGGVRFLAPKTALEGLKSVTVTFPWSNGTKFSAVAEVVRKDSADDERALVAARFSQLSTADQHRLEKLLRMLHGMDEQGDAPRIAMAPVLEIFFGDSDDIHVKLDEIIEGRLTATVFECYEPGQSIRLVLGGIADVPALRLRARVIKTKAVSINADSEWPLFKLELRFEHPAEELKAAAASLGNQLESSRPGSEEVSDDLAENDLLPSRTNLA
ncbi:PilZ domain-containing protein [Thioflavicoccus mobilis 8321]|uniref:PilZ domain-containing protein n=1 Tax=Thioflavicoccus mobilis 8321 TaxID=765912 RepID=L0GZ94_9GAMM|nr:PilZ domain-containing protein [Thioflavicoccus mobilis]AGA90700.1 PilZ domain-containing protein [Thioflavicoccus mobilis 8321]